MKKILNIIIYCICIFSLFCNILLLNHSSNINKTLKKMQEENESCLFKLDVAETASENMSIELDNTYEEISYITNELNTCKTQLKN